MGGCWGSDWNALAGLPAIRACRLPKREGEGGSGGDSGRGI